MKVKPFAGMVAIALCSVLLTAQGPSQLGLEEVFADYWSWRLADNPELATFMGRSDYNDRWTDLSKTARDKRRAERQEYLQKALYFAPGTLNASQKLSVALLEYQLRDVLDNGPYLDVIETVSQADGFHNDVFETIDAMPARTSKDYENIIARIRKVPMLVDQTLDMLREQIAAGETQPSNVVTMMLDQMEAQSRITADESPLLDAFRKFPASVPVADRERLKREAADAFTKSLVPAWRKAQAFLRMEYLPRARPQIAVTSMANGKDAYAALIRHYTTTKMSAEQIHQLGLQEVQRIEGEMEKIARQSGFNGSVADFEKQLAARPGMKFTSKEEMLTYARDVAMRVQPELPRLFKRLPRIPFGVRPISPDREAATASNYARGTADASRAGWFNMNTYKPQEQVKYRVEALVLHETIPGHHLQNSIALELPGLPDFRKAFSASAYSEGWGLYAESLGPELGSVYLDPASKFGQLASERFRAVRLVVDTGIHALGWSRDKAREYFAQHVPGESIAEVDRYIARPGQALGYKLGELRIKDLRRRAERELGPRFDIREFHDAVLRNGILPLDLLDREVSDAMASAGNSLH